MALQQSSQTSDLRREESADRSVLYIFLMEIFFPLKNPHYFLIKQYKIQKYWVLCNLLCVILSFVQIAFCTRYTLEYSFVIILFAIFKNQVGEKRIYLYCLLHFPRYVVICIVLFIYSFRFKLLFSVLSCSASKTPFGISCRPRCLAKHSISFCLPGNVLISSLFFEGLFCWI